MIHRNNAGRPGAGFISVFENTLAGVKNVVLCAGMTLQEADQVSLFPDV